MKRLIQFDISGATAKTCGKCPNLRIVEKHGRCMVFFMRTGFLSGHAPIALQRAPGGGWRRAPECIAAERKG